LHSPSHNGGVTDEYMWCTMGATDPMIIGGDYNRICYTNMIMLHCRICWFDTPHPQSRRRLSQDKIELKFFEQGLRQWLGETISVRVLYPRYHGPLVTAQRNLIQPRSLQRQMAGEPSTPDQICSHLSWLKRMDHQLKRARPRCDLY
jgi:hypothetical protein